MQKQTQQVCFYVQKVQEKSKISEIEIHPNAIFLISKQTNEVKEQMTKYFIKGLISVFAAVSLFAASALAQGSVTGAISGKVTDPQGAIVTGATVTVTNPATNASVTVTSADDGVFKVTNLQPGKYRVETTATGFGKGTADVIVEVGVVTNVDMPLKIGEATAEVNITAEAPVVNVEDNANSTNVNETSIMELPINGRRASDFVRLAPGVNPEGDFGLNSFRGLSALLNNNTLDGTDNNNTFFSEERGRTRIQYSVSQAAVREFQVNTSNYSAEYGRAAGGVINTVTRSGSNDFHGQVFYFQRNNSWGARNPSAFLPTPAGPVSIKPEDIRHQFGGAIGGPIVKDKLFFFFTYDQQKRSFPGVATTSSATALNPITVSAPANCAASGLSVGQTLFCRGVSQSQTDSALTFLRDLTGEVPRSQNQRIFFPKIDWNINSKNLFTASYNRLRTVGLSAFQTPAVVFVGRAGFGDDFVDIDTFNARLTTTVSSTTINEFRFQFGKEFARSILGELTPGEEALASRATTNVDGRLTSINFTNGLQFGTSNNFQRAKFPDERTIQFADTVTMTSGNHGMKFGGDVKFTKDDIDNLRTEFGAFQYNNVQDLITDYTFVTDPTFTDPTVSNASLKGKRYANYNQGFGLAAYTLKTPDVALFFQDNWRLAPTFTLNLGLRYEWQSYGSPQFPNLSQATLTAGQTRYSLMEANSIVAQTTQFPSDMNNFSPRIGFAWDLTGDGKNSLRAGYGLYYGRIPNTFLTSPLVNTGAPGSQLATGNIFNNTTLRDANGVLIPTPLLANTLAAVPVRTLAIVVMSPQLENPEIHQGDVIFERQIANNTAISVSYLFNFGRKIPAFVDLNLGLPTTTRTYTVSGGDLDGQTFTTPFFSGPRPISNFGSIIEVQGSAKSSYHALVIQANRRFSNGLQFQTSYTWANAKDQGQQLGTFAPTFPTVSNPFDRSVDDGRSDLDIKHRFVASAVWDIGDSLGWESGVAGAIFKGLQLAPIVSISSGRSVTGFVSASPSGGTSSGLLGSGGPQRTFFRPRGEESRPSTATVDLRASKRIFFGETMSLEILGEAFNLFNRSNFTGIMDRVYTFTVASNTLVFDPTYLTPTTINNTINYTPRQIQLGVRFHF